LGDRSNRENVRRHGRPIVPDSAIEEFSLKDKRSSHHLEVQAFLFLERIAGSKEFAVSVLLQAGGQFIGKTSLGTVAEGQEIMLSLRWDKPRQRFVASSKAAGSMPVLSFIPFASHDAAHDVVPPEFSMTKSFTLNSDVSNDTEAHENKN
jgi:hypothetical protein